MRFRRYTMLLSVYLLAVSPFSFSRLICARLSHRKRFILHISNFSYFVSSMQMTLMPLINDHKLFGYTRPLLPTHP